MGNVILLSERMETAIERWREMQPGRPRFNNSELARHAGVTRAAVGDWRSGRTKEISALNLFDVARYLRVEPEWLGNGNGPMTRANTDHRNHAAELDELARHYMLASEEGRRQILRLAYLEAAQGPTWLGMPHERHVGESEALTYSSVKLPKKDAQ